VPDIFPTRIFCLFAFGCLENKTGYSRRKPTGANQHPESKLWIFFLLLSSVG
jgi:hypothetical protein